MTRQSLLHSGISCLKKAGSLDAAYEARYLLEETLGVDPVHFLMDMEAEVGSAAEELYKIRIEERTHQVPLQQILGKAPFYGREFYVNRHVLIPRFDSETLIEAVKPHLENGMSLLDIGTGSGCLILTLLLEAGEMGLSVKGTGVDISEKALEAACENARRYPACAITFKQSDLFSEAGEMYDIIISNPPYIRRDVIPTLDEEVREHEPMSALDGGEDGLDFYRQITAEAGKHLMEKGYLFFEIGYDQGEDVRELMEEQGFKNVSVLKDLSGNDRVVWGIRKPYV